MNCKILLTPASLCVILLTALIILLTALSSCGGSGDGDGPIDGARAKAHTQKLVDFGPRPAGSKNLSSAALYIKGQLKALGLTPNEQRFTAPTGKDQKGKPIKFQNIWAQIPGEDPENGPIIMLCSHYDTKLCEGHANGDHNFPFVGAIDGSGSSGLLLELGRVLTERNKDPKGKANIWLVWFDGEESLPFDWSDDHALFGSTHFAKTMAADKKLFPKGMSRRIQAFVLMDLVGDTHQKLDRDGNSAKSLQDMFGKAAKEMGESERMYKYSSSFKDDHIPFTHYGLRVIDLIDFQYRVPASRGAGEPKDVKHLAAWWHTREDTMDHVSADSLAFVGNLVWTTIPKIEAKYCRAP